MVSNRDLFRKMMSLPKELSMAKMREAGLPPFHPGFGVPGRPPFGMDHKPEFGEPGRPPFGMTGRPEFGAPGMPQGGMDGHPGFPGPGPGCGRGPAGHGFGRGPAGPMRKGMNRERMLTIISEHPEGIRQKDLAEAAGINASSASEVVSRLEDDGYLVRVIDENDKRATLLKLTEMGAVRAEEIRSERDSFLDEIFSRLTEEEKQTLSDLLDKLLGKE